MHFKHKKSSSSSPHHHQQQHYQSSPYYSTLSSNNYSIVGSNNNSYYHNNSGKSSSYHHNTTTYYNAPPSSSSTLTTPTTTSGGLTYFDTATSSLTNHHLVGSGSSIGGGQQGFYSNVVSSNTAIEWYNTNIIETIEDNRVIVSDNYDEIIWTGTSNGKVIGYYHPTMEKYCSFRAFDSDQDMKQLIVQKERIYSLCGNGFAIHSRGGAYRYSFEDPNLFQDQLLTCCFFSDYSSSSSISSPLRLSSSSSSIGSSNTNLLLGGNFTKLINFDLYHQKINQQVETNQGICTMKLGGRYLCCGGTLGELSLRDPKTLKNEHAFEVHTGTISDIAVKDNVLVTCGFTNRYGELCVDNIVKAFDLRTLRMLGQVHFPLDPTFLGFHPRFSSTLIMVSQTGYFQFKDLQAAFNHSFQESQMYKINCGSVNSGNFNDNSSQSSIIQTFDISTSGNVLLFGDSSGLIHTWSNHSVLDLNYNNQSGIDEYKTLNNHRLVDDDNFIKIDGNNLLSDWPNFSYLVGQHPLEIHPQILDNLQFKKLIPSKLNYGVTINPGLKRVTDGYLERRTFRDFLQQQSSQSTTSNKKTKVLNVIPKEFSLNLVKDNLKFRFQGFDFSKYNNTKYIGLENNLGVAPILNSYIQVLYHLVPQLRISLMNFLSMDDLNNSNSTNNYSLATELGFLFTLMEQNNKVEKKAIEAINFYKTLHKLNLQFLEPKVLAKMSAAEIIQKFNQFLLKELHEEMSNITYSYSMTWPYIFSSPNYKFIRINNTNNINNKKQQSSSVGVTTVATNNSNIKLLKNKKRQRTMIDILFGSEVQLQRNVVDTIFDHTLKTNSNNLNNLNYNFENVLNDTLNNNSLLTLPNIFNLNFPLKMEDIRWLRNSNKDNITGTSIPLNFTVFQTPIDKSKWQAFIFNDEKQKQQQEMYYNISSSSSVGGLNSPQQQKRIPPMSITYTLKAVVLQVRHPFKDVGKYKDEQSSPNSNNSNNSYETLDGSETPTIINQILEEDEVEEDVLLKKYEGHCVSIIKIGNEWILFNDFSISTQKEKDALIYTQTWKSPALLFYVRQDIQNVLPTLIYNNPLVSLVNNQNNIDNYFFKSNEFKNIINFKGDIVAIDAEFVQTKRELLIDNRQYFSLGRVSIITKDEEILIDDYISTSEEDIEDYMTRYSGLRPGELNITNNTNTHHVTELRNTYLKLKYLLDIHKVKFVGHGLQNDFKIINIFVPNEQIIDTVELYNLPNQRKIALRFLCKYLLNIDIQQETHDSIEDAKTALRLYKKYLELKQKGTFISTLQEIYNIGRQTNWQ
ncbi:hypothetical protein ABK040_014819 [Willaertia magna]